MAGTRVLLVEGKDNEHVVKNICGRLGLGKIDKIRPAEGIKPLLEMLPVQLRESDLAVLGIILDADDDLTARWRALVDRFAEAGYPDINDQPAEEGTILLSPSDLLPKVGIWVMPNNQIPGMLEDFLKFLIPENDLLLEHAQQSLEGLPDQRFAATHRPKALMHTWLAWQEEPGKPYGQAITARYLDADLPLGKSFAAWLQKTFFE